MTFEMKRPAGALAGLFIPGALSLHMEEAIKKKVFQYYIGI